MNKASFKDAVLEQKFHWRKHTLKVGSCRVQSIISSKGRSFRTSQSFIHPSQNVRKNNVHGFYHDGFITSSS